MQFTPILKLDWSSALYGRREVWSNAPRRDHTNSIKIRATLANYEQLVEKYFSKGRDRMKIVRRQNSGLLCVRRGDLQDDSCTSRLNSWRRSFAWRVRWTCRRAALFVVGFLSSIFNRPRQTFDVGFRGIYTSDRVGGWTFRLKHSCVVHIDEHGRISTNCVREDVITLL